MAYLHKYIFKSCDWDTISKNVQTLQIAIKALEERFKFYRVFSWNLKRDFSLNLTKFLNTHS
jgi:hypothetical protein